MLVRRFAIGLVGVDVASAPASTASETPRVFISETPQWNGPVLVDAWRAATEGLASTAKAVLPGPYSLAVAAQLKGTPNATSLALAVAEAVGAEARALAAAGAPLIEVDEPALAAPDSDWPLAHAALERLCAVASAPLALAVWGGDVVALEGLFALPFQVFSLDLVAGPRNWQLIDRFPAGPKLGLGIIDGTNPALEHPPSMSNALWSVTMRISPSRLQIHPSAPLDGLTPDEARAKLELLVRVAREADG